MCCNPAKGRVEFEDGWLIKPSLITKDEIKACQLTRTKIQKKKKKKIHRSNFLKGYFLSLGVSKFVSTWSQSRLLISTVQKLTT
jgi:hypothetical protein